VALTSVDIERYLKIALNVSDLPKRDFYLSYDAKADVVYINFHNPPRTADDSELTDDDVIIRYDEREEVVGLTILHARKRQSKSERVSRRAISTQARRSAIEGKRIHPLGNSRLRPNSSRTPG
jgi:uncharacterized protein YuzE